MPNNIVTSHSPMEYSFAQDLEQTLAFAFDAHTGFCEDAAAPVPDAHAAPLERLLDALRDDNIVLLLRADEEGAAAWLTAPRIDRLLRQALVEPAQTCVWPLTSGVWAISLKGSGGMEQTAQALHVHALRHTLAAQIQTEWQNEGNSDAAGEDVFSILPVAAGRVMEGVEDNLAELNLLLDILVNKQLHAQFQPIVNLHDGQVFGYEALIRGPKGGTLRRPGALFRAAHKARMVAWFDLACQEQCFALAATQGLKHLLFINMEAEGLAFLDMHDRPLATRARDCGLSPANIVIEITERQAVEDFPRLVQSIVQLREQGFKIAIDDAGAGYSSLHVIAELRPDFVKIDRALVRNLDTNGERRALLAALVQYARSIGTHILAEGSETIEELGTLIDLGVTYGQGYLMGKPADTFRGVSRETREFIQARQRRRQQTLAGRMIRVGELARAGKTLPPDACISVAASSFYKNPSQTSVVVVEDGQARGLLMRQSLEHILDMARSARMEGLLPQESVAQWMQTHFLRASEEQTAAAIARQATTRTDISLEYDIVIVDRGGGYAGTLPMRILMETVAGVQENRLRYADPLTGLPNRVLLEQEMADRLEARGGLALARIDLNGLSAYNRLAGLARGDEAIRALSRLLQNVEQFTPHEEGANANAQTVGQTPAMQTPFVAHLGGGGFALLCHPDQIEGLVERILMQFARHHPLLHTCEELRRGGMENGERNGGAKREPLLACAIAVVTNRARRYANPAPMLLDAESLLRQIKCRPGSLAAIDRLPKDEAAPRSAPAG